MGVRTACALAHLKPEWVRGLVLVDLGLSGIAGGGLGESLSAFLRVLPEKLNSRAEAREFMKQNCPDSSIAQYLMAVSVAAPNGEVTFPFDHESLLKTLEAARGFDLRPWVQECSERGIPVLALRGANSKVWSKEEYEAERARFAGVTLVTFKEIEGAGHGLPFEKRQEFVAELKSFTSAR